MNIKDLIIISCWAEGIHNKNDTKKNQDKTSN